MAKRAAQGTLACCPACRLLQSSADRPCRFCGDARTTVMVDTLVARGRRRRVQRRTPTRRGWRWFDLVFAGGLFVAPLEAERRDPAWMIPALLAVATGWALLRLALHLLSRYRVVSQRLAPRIEAVAAPATADGRPTTVRGIARRLDASTDAHLLERRCLVASLALEPEAEPGRVRLRTVRAVPFVIETDDGRRVIVEGELSLVGKTTAERPADAARRHLGGSRLDALWLEGAVAREVLLENRMRVEVSGGVASEREGEAHGVIAGVPGNPARVTQAGA